jgi:VWFA-related protein
MRYRLVLLVAALALLTIRSGSTAQDGLRVDVRLVNVVASVTDTRGNFVADLSKEDFAIEEDGVPQKIAHFSQDHDVPVSVGIVLDVSGSMQPKMQTATQAVDRFLQGIHQDDDIFLMTFAASIDVIQDFTNDRKRLSHALQSVHLSTSTALYGAVERALDKVRQGKHEKRAILLITDGQNTVSKPTFNEVLQRVRQAEILVYCLGTAPMTYAEPTEHVPFSLPTVLAPARLMPQRRGLPQGRGGTPAAGRGQFDTVNMNVLNELADNSGGRAYRLSETFIGGQTTEIDKALTQIADELRSQYTLAYYPTSAEDGKYHTIRVTTRSGLVVRTRRGYQAGAN